MKVKLRETHFLLNNILDNSPLRITQIIEMRSFRNPFPYGKPEILLVYFESIISFQRSFAFIEWFPDTNKLGQMSLAIDISYLNGCSLASPEQESSLDLIAKRWNLRLVLLLYVAHQCQDATEPFEEEISEAVEVNFFSLKDFFEVKKN